MARNFLLSLVVLCSLILFGCSKSPNEHDVEQAIKQYYQSLALSDAFEVTNVFTYSITEKDKYTILADVNYELQFKKNLNDFIQQNENTKIKLASYKMQYGNFKTGDVMDKTETVTLIKVEDSWILNR